MGDTDPLIVDVSHDSRAVGPGTLFVAVPGRIHDGHRFAAEAISAGAAAVCVQRILDVDRPQLVVPDTRAVLGRLAAAVWGDPSQRLFLVGVTGTNGKTTVTHLVESIGRAAGVRTGLVGTVGARIDGREIPVAHTTPEASDFQRLLAHMVDEGVDLAAVEVSSHALELGRVEATCFSVGAFTNLSPEHLDFHGDMESYFAAKRHLFDLSSRAVVWIEDPYGRRLADELQPITVGWEDGDDPPDVACRVLEETASGSRIRITLPTGDTFEAVLPLLGVFNAANAAVAAACGHLAGFDPHWIAEGLRSTSGVPGRFELVTSPDGFSVVIDYAHSPAAIEAMVEAARRLAEGRVIVVFGAGGDRDRSKRPLMGRAAARADLVVVTSDNPRTEDPAAIIAEVLSGVPPETEPIVEVDRGRAIRLAVEQARPGDLVLVLGKGHERGQEIGGQVFPFDDREIVSRMVQERRG